MHHDMPEDPNPPPPLPPRYEFHLMDELKSFMTGMLAAQIAAVFTNPIDVVKIRLQVQGEAAVAAASGAAASSASKPPTIGLLGMFVHVARNEGLMALQKGLLPSILRETFYSSIRLSAYEPIRDMIMNEEERVKGASFAKKFAAGASAGGIGAGLANPADLVKVRLQAASGEAYPSTWGAFAAIYREGGIAGLYRGTLPTVQRAAILTATQLGTRTEYCIASFSRAERTSVLARALSLSLLSAQPRTTT